MDVLIMGGGPAGAAAARLLALWGHSVTVVTRPRVEGATFGVSIPPSTNRLFQVLGVEPRLARTRSVRSTGHTVWWRAGEARVETFAPGECGWQIDLDDLSSALLDAAVDAGVRVEFTRVTDVATAREAWPSTLVIDCSGRVGIVARARGWRVHEAGLRTVALTGVWSARGRLPVEDDTHTLIEAYEDGWAWSIPIAQGAKGDGRRATGEERRANGERYVAVMVDPQRSELSGGGAREMYLKEIAKTTRFAEMLRDARLRQGPSGWDASMYWSQHYAEGDVLIAGDAGSFIDPLSSIGVKKALASAWLAAVAAHTALVTPNMKDAAFGFFEAREREVYREFRAMTIEHLAEAGRQEGFWDHEVPSQGSSTGFRHEVPSQGSSTGFRHEVPSQGSSAGFRHGVPSRGSVEAVWAEIRTADSVRFERAGGLLVEGRAAVRGNLIVHEPRVVSGADDPGVRFVRDVDVVVLIEMAPSFDDVGAMYGAYVQRAAPVALPDFAAALATAVARGWLVCYK